MGDFLKATRNVRAVSTIDVNYVLLITLEGNRRTAAYL